MAKVTDKCVSLHTSTTISKMPKSWQGETLLTYKEWEALGGWLKRYWPVLKEFSSNGLAHVACFGIAKKKGQNPDGWEVEPCGLSAKKLGTSIIEEALDSSGLTD